MGSGCKSGDLDGCEIWLGLGWIVNKGTRVGVRRKFRELNVCEIQVKSKYLDGSEKWLEWSWYANARTWLEEGQDLDGVEMLI